ncbi:hypothetical protein JCM33374_g1187 [Metschnikowia sp. JCM 33374]|nr:hypothetical protein JCM33374_g1187 [Metschnikowia sp. JCM 33374]
MALRNYLYAKHSSPAQAALISKEPVSSTMDAPSCPPERALVLEDGTKVCANCADCPKKVKADDGSPKIRVQVENEVDYTTML